MLPNKMDFGKIEEIYNYTRPENIPVKYTVGDKTYNGIPKEFSPKVVYRKIDSSTTETVVTGITPNGITLQAECTVYRDHPVVEWVMFMTNSGKQNSQVISNWNLNLVLPVSTPMLYHGNGDTCTPEGYEWWTDPITSDSFIKRPCGDGTSCNGAFPYMRLLDENGGFNIAIGWSGTWKAELSLCDGGVSLSVGQAEFRSYLKPGECVRTPRLTLHAYTGDNNRGMNLWRAFYIDRWLPKENGAPLSSKLILHTFMADGKPEFCGATEENQTKAIDEFIQSGLKPDIWWIDAGWYPCSDDWTRVGSWYPNPENLPNGLAPIGEKLMENDIDFLLWFEPERVRRGSDIWNEHPEFLLKCESNETPWISDNALLNLGNPAALEYILEKVDRLIKESHVKVYRQDFNFPPMPYWDNNAEADREGILENLHIQGYYRFWDELAARNPGLIIDSCASGGRRNDPETMRRSIPFHYTDVGYGDHRIKQKQHRQMFEWIPYFRAHTYNWDTPDGVYVGSYPGKVDDFSYHNALTPALTSMIEYDSPEEIKEVGRRFHPIWRHAAELELTANFYPLTECKKDEGAFFAMQFDGEKSGFVQIIRNIAVADGHITLKNLHIDADKTYTFTDALGKRTRTATGKSVIKDGFEDNLPPRSGVIWFYEKN